jgi:AbrB family looped-hinge helix DNA binding protein
MQEATMDEKDRRIIGRCYGTAVLGPRGQVVIPVDARKELGIDAGSRLLVFGHFEGRGLVFIKAEAAEELLNVMASRLGELAKLIKEGGAAGAGAEGGSAS